VVARDGSRGHILPLRSGIIVPQAVTSASAATNAVAAEGVTLTVRVVPDG
jgi:hypothetical protein